MRDDDRGRPRRVLAYTRVSGVAQEQRGNSLPEQRAELERFCKEHSYPAPTLFVEVESGTIEKVEKREEQIVLMAQLRSGDLVLCTKQDRWTRDAEHYLNSVRKILAAGARFFSIAEKYDPSTPEGELASTMMAAFARHEHARIRDRTVGMRQILRRQGLHVEGQPPMGYVVKDRRLTIEPRAAEVIRYAFDLCADGYSARQISAAIASKYPWARGCDVGNLGRKLRDRRYIGESCTVGQCRGEWRPTHEPIISAETFYRAAAGMAERKLGGRPLTGVARNASFLLRGLALCGHCGHRLLSHSPTPGGRAKHGGWYMCGRRTNPMGRERCDGPIARHEDVDAEVARLTLERLESLADLLAKPPASRAPTKTTNFEAERAKIMARRSRLVDAIADGILSADLAREKLATIEKALAKLEERRAVELMASAPPVDRSALLRQVKHVRLAWEKLSVGERRDVVRQLAERVEVMSTAAKKWARGAWSLEITWNETD